MKKALLVALVAVSAFNLGFFVYWIHIADPTAVMPNEDGGYTVEALALNVTILEMILVLVGFILAALGLFGYTEIKNVAVRKAVEAAEKEARSTVNEQIELLKSVLSKSDNGAPEYEGDYTVDSQDVEGATQAKGE